MPQLSANLLAERFFELDGVGSHNLRPKLGANVSPGPWAIVRAATALADDTSAQAIFATANDTLTVAPATTYFFEMVLMLDKGTSSADVKVLFAGTATYTSVRYLARNFDAASFTAEPVRGTAATATVIAAGHATATIDAPISGYLSISAAGTVIPQVQFSAAPGGTNTVAIGTFIRLTPVGSDTASAGGGDWS